MKFVSKHLGGRSTDERLAEFVTKPNDDYIKIHLHISEVYYYKNVSKEHRKYFLVIVEQISQMKWVQSNGKNSLLI